MTPTKIRWNNPTQSSPPGKKNITSATNARLNRQLNQSQKREAAKYTKELK